MLNEKDTLLVWITSYKVENYCQSVEILRREINIRAVTFRFYANIKHANQENLYNCFT